MEDRGYAAVPVSHPVLTDRNHLPRHLTPGRVYYLRENGNPLFRRDLVLVNDDSGSEQIYDKAWFVRV